MRIIYIIVIPRIDISFHFEELFFNCISNIKILSVILFVYYMR